MKRNYKNMQHVRRKLQIELADLEDELRFKIPKEIQKAREYGDLKENAEYKAALERQKIVSARLVQLSQRLGELDSIDMTKIPTDRAAYGSTLKLYDVDRDMDVIYKLVTSEESDPDNGLISTVSPIGQGLMGKEEGDEVRIKTQKGWRSFEVKKLTTIHDQVD
jgi:transcription elongation factor GreA